MQTPEEFAEDFREWMVANAQWPMLGDANATRKLEQIIRARDAEIRRECADRAARWLIERTSTIDPALMATNSGKWLIRLRERQTAELRAAIIGEEE